MSVLYNHYIDNETLDKEYLKILRTRVIHPKYKFIGKEQAKSWVEACSSPKSPYYTNLYRFIESISAEMIDSIQGNINLIALGGSNGVKDKPLLQQGLKQKNITYNIVDSGKDLINHSLDTISDIDIPKEVFLSEFDSHRLKLISSQIRKDHNPVHLFTILSNTFGAYPQEHICQCIRDAMNKNDYVLIEAHLAPDEITPRHIQKIINNYKNPIYSSHVMHVCHRVGITEDDGYLELEYSNDRFFPELNVVKYYFKFNKPKVLEYMGELIYFSKDERIEIFSSNKYKIQTLRDILSNHGFVIKKEWIDTVSNSAEMLCQII